LETKNGPHQKDPPNPRHGGGFAKKKQRAKKKNYPILTGRWGTAPVVWGCGWGELGGLGEEKFCVFPPPARPPTWTNRRKGLLRGRSLGQKKKNQTVLGGFHAKKKEKPQKKRVKKIFLQDRFGGVNCFWTPWKKRGGGVGWKPPFHSFRSPIQKNFVWFSFHQMYGKTPLCFGAPRWVKKGWGGVVFFLGGGLNKPPWFVGGVHKNFTFVWGNPKQPTSKKKEGWKKRLVKNPPPPLQKERPGPGFHTKLGG